MYLIALIVANHRTTGRFERSRRSDNEHCYPGHAIVFLAAKYRKQSRKRKLIRFTDDHHSIFDLLDMFAFRLAAIPVPVSIAISIRRRVIRAVSLRWIHGI